MLTWTPDNFASSIGCGLCGIVSQVLSPAVDPDTGELLFRDDGGQVLVNDEQAAAVELGGHMGEVHPYLLDADGRQLLTANGNPARANVTLPSY